MVGETSVPITGTIRIREDKEKRQTTDSNRMGVEQAWQISSATPFPKILVHCIIDFIKKTIYKFIQLKICISINFIVYSI
jgi:hypothetical protein